MCVFPREERKLNWDLKSLFLSEVDFPFSCSPERGLKGIVNQIFHLCGMMWWSKLSSNKHQRHYSYVVGLLAFSALMWMWRVSAFLEPEWVSPDLWVPEGHTLRTHLWLASRLSLGMVLSVRPEDHLQAEQPFQKSWEHLCCMAKILHTWVAVLREHQNLPLKLSR